MTSYQGMTAEQARLQRELDWLAVERKAVIAAARQVLDRIRTGDTEDAATARAWQRAGMPIREQLADLIDAQRAIERQGLGVDNRDGDAVLRAWVEALRGPRNEARDAARSYPEGDGRISGLVRRANAYTAAIKALIAAGEAAIAEERRAIARDREWLAPR